ncbi:protein-PII uridylyltransferase [Endozoicomonas montiporae]|uniref:Bifunctional uridylyltransferase/uridylyl-removing enzyme n=2 Tax=Endozoicomonas montiporae TaxID=1027273 RepID=A0A081NBM2_9GAMM|nr:[protein-PII] uridylyltransferase [Endozoicomonas montiporae]AMO56139.1 PII uridylyl-transferase [Endozoicomonas montiporae CL-33]KEQ15845.1 protein-PII uridylyltransferase [Endozoicomonas montiporae]
MTTHTSHLLQNELFNRSQFRADITLSNSAIPAYKKAISSARERLNQWFREERDIESLIGAHTWFMDEILTVAWEHLDWSNGCDIALLAVGGYGREELHPASDIDILLLLADNHYESHKDNIERFLTLLWDIGLKVGSSVRSVDECAIQAKDDLTIMTNLLEARLLSGPETLPEQLQERISPLHMWPSKTYLQAKFDEQRERHRKFDDSEYNLEPNIKSSPGGIRDIHMLGWVTRRHFGTHDLKELVDIGFLSPNEHQQMQRCKAFLWKVRWGLHTIAGRCEDRLLFDHQRTLATLFGYHDHNDSLAVEQFMQSYFRTVLIVGQLKDLLLQHFDDAILNADQPQTITSINERFQIRNQYIETTSENVFDEHPPAMLEMFVLMTRNSDILGPTAETIRRLREHRHLVDSDFRKDPRCAKLFIKLLQAPYALTANLRRMARYGILGRYLPEFGRIIGQMQFDLFHTYTVDAHTLLLVKHLRSFNYQENQQRYPVASQLIKEIKNPELLYIAAIYHDIGKGRGGDHSQLGAVDAELFCRRHGLKANDTRLVIWLVREHLTLSTTAQKQDLSDPQVIQDFARKMGSVNYLNFLYLLTVADINATNSELWNGWRSSLLQQLYRRTRRMLEGDMSSLTDIKERVEGVKERAIKRLAGQSLDHQAISQLWSTLGVEYFTRHGSREIAWHTENILKHGSSKPLVIVQETDIDQQELGGSRVFIYTPDQPNLFAAAVAALDQLHLSIQDAKIITSSDNYSMDTFTVLEDDGRAIGQNPKRIQQIKRHLQLILENTEDFPDLISRRTPRQLRHFARRPEVLISNIPGIRRTLLEIKATDRPGLLAKIGRTFMSLNLQVHNAKIATFGEKVEDRFYITDDRQQPINDPEFAKTICESLKETLQRATQADHISSR